MRRKLALLNFAVAASLVLSFAALTGGQVAAKTIHHKTVNLTLAGWASTPTEPKDLQIVINAFQKDNPGYKVKLEEYNGNTYPTTIESAIAAGGGPDVFYVNNDKFRQWQEAKALYPLNSFIAKDPGYHYTQIYKSLRNGFTVNGKVYGIDKDYSTLGLFVNTDMWKAAKMGKAPTTWAQFASDACKLRHYEKTHGHSNVYGAGFANDEWRWQALLKSRNGSVVNQAQTKSTIDTNAGLSSIRDYAHLVKKGCAAWFNTQQGWSGGQFEEGDAAMVWEGPWLLPSLQTTYPNIHYKVYPLPFKGNLEFTVAYSMNPNAKNKEAAWKLLSYLTGYKGEKLWVDYFKVLPARSNVPPPNGDQPFLQGAKYAYTVLPRPHWSDPGNSPYNVLNNDLKKVSTGSMTAKQAAVDVTNAINHWLSVYGK
jgi:multiple sugar transport system substrate-binding protein